MGGMALPQLPPGFRFGASTAAYQIEGAATEDGKGPSIWDTFCAEPGRIVDGSSGAVACDHYHRYVEDVGLMKQLGLHGYRLSMSWPRVRADVGFYDRLIDELLTQGVAPMVTLYHWDLPQDLEDAGGWLNRDTAERFAEYAATVGERFADRVEYWIPVNEPNVVTLMGYAVGMHAPGRTLMFDALPAAHHLLLGHGLAVQALRSAGATSVGCANNHAPIWPATNDDAEAAQLFDALWNRLFIDPMLLGSYPAELASLLEPVVREGDLATLQQPLDFYGLNYYNPFKIAAAEGDLPFEFRDVEGYPRTDFGWPVVPDAMRDLLVHLHGAYPLPPVYVTESGCAYAELEDQARIDYLDAHLRAVAEAVERSVDVRGYYTWSLMDNFEWAEGFTKRFGLVHVDYDTLVRTPRASFEWYRQVIAAQ